MEKKEYDGLVADFHAHTRYSSCGRDDPEALVLEMIRCGVNVLGITDHHYGIGDRKGEYFRLLTDLKEKYKDRITLYRGIEIATVDWLELDRSEDISYFDYCLVEHIDRADSVVGSDVTGYIGSLNLKAGIAHTDLFGYVRDRGLDPFSFFGDLKKKGIFWEMNVSYDSTHQYREHEYVKEFFRNTDQQKLIRDVGLQISVGFDGHKMEDYRVDRVRDACRFLSENGFNLLTGF
ncbi:MAG: PHP domain-containing protein [Candidatus Borkfalkiaceae bacterium]|nr:PHP domain-containing protein [Christensenellaceae bacterium]